MHNESLQHKFERYLTFLEKDPRNINILEDVALLARDLGAYEQSIEYFKQACALNVTPKLQFELAETLMMFKKFGDALGLLEEIESNDSNMLTSVLYNRAYCLAAQNKFQEADKVLKPLYDSESNHLKEVSLLRIRINHMLGDLNSAKILIGSYFKNWQADAESFGVFSLVFLDDGDSQLAKEYSEKALLLNSLQREALIVKGMLAIDVQDADLSQDFFQKALTIDKQSGRTWLGLGLSEMLKNDLASAELKIQKALSFMPEHIGSWVTLAWNQLSQQKFDEALKTIDEALRIDRNFAESHGTLAVILIAKGKIDQATREKDLAIRLNPFCFSGLYAKSLLLAHKGSPEVAEQLIQDALNTPFLNDGRTLNDVIFKIANNQNEL